MKNISVIIPAHIRNSQEADWLKIALESIPPKTPVVVVNDHSLIPWSEVEAVVDFGNSRVEQLPDDKKGLAACRNYAMKFVLTDFFFPLDADDYLAPDALSIVMAKYTGDGFMYGSTILFDDRQKTTYQARPYDICKLIKSVYWPNGCLQKVENYHKVGGWDESLPLYEDWDYWLRSAKAGIIGHHIPDVLYYYRQNPNGIIQTLKRSPDMTKRAREMIMTRHKDYFGDDIMCCGKKAPPMNIIRTNKTVTSPAGSAPIPQPMMNGMTLLTYLGKGLARSFYGESGTCYRFSENKRKFGYVAQEDVEGMLKLRENGKFLFAIEVPKAEVEVMKETPAPVITPVIEIIEEVVNPLPAVEEVVPTPAGKKAEKTTTKTTTTRKSSKKK
jgi:hypothetical protein